LRRGDQLAVAALLLAALGATAGWWLAQGGLQGRLVEVERQPYRRAAFLVDVNAAGWPELAHLPGSGETLARRIVESRTTQGPFREPRDLLRIRGIGPITLRKIEPYLLPMDTSNTLVAK